MKIGIISDTHGSLTALRKVVSMAPPVEFWIHCGDYAFDGERLEGMTGLTVYSVAGNCDVMRGPVTAKPDQFLKIEDRRIWVTHGHLYMNETRSVREMGWWGQRLEQDLVIFGHTHVPVFEQQGNIWLINPGSPSRPRAGSAASFAVLSLQKGQPPAVEFIPV